MSCITDLQVDENSKRLNAVEAQLASILTILGRMTAVDDNLTKSVNMLVQDVSKLKADIIIAETENAI